MYETESIPNGKGINNRYIPTRLEWLWIVLNSTSSITTDSLTINFYPLPDDPHLKCVIRVDSMRGSEKTEILSIAEGIQDFFDSVVDIYGWSEDITLQIVVEEKGDPTTSTVLSFDEKSAYQNNSDTPIETLEN